MFVRVIVGVTSRRMIFFVLTIIFFDLVKQLNKEYLPSGRPPTGKQTLKRITSGRKIICKMSLPSITDVVVLFFRNLLMTPVKLPVKAQIPCKGKKNSFRLLSKCVLHVSQPGSNKIISNFYLPVIGTSRYLFSIRGLSNLNLFPISTLVVQSKLVLTAVIWRQKKTYCTLPYESHFLFLSVKSKCNQLKCVSVGEHQITLLN